MVLCLLPYILQRLAIISLSKDLPLITVDPGWNSKNTEPFLYKDLGHGERLLIWSYKSLAIFGKGICENKDVLFAPLRCISLGESLCIMAPRVGLLPDYPGLSLGSL